MMNSGNLNSLFNQATQEHCSVDLRAKLMSLLVGVFGGYAGGALIGLTRAESQADAFFSWGIGGASISFFLLVLCMWPFERPPMARPDSAAPELPSP